MPKYSTAIHRFDGHILLLEDDDKARLMRKAKLFILDGYAKRIKEDIAAIIVNEEKDL